MSRHRVTSAWFDKLLLWRRAYQTKISNDQLGVVARGPTAHASEEAALRRWVEAYPKKILRRAHDAASARTMAWLSGVKFIFPGTAFATRERRFCVIPRYRFRYWEPGAFSVPGHAVFCRSPWYRFRYYFLYFQV